MARNSLDELSRAILETLRQAGEPLDTKEIENSLSKLMHGVTRIKLVMRLHNLRGQALIRGKSLGSGRGAWVWWCESGPSGSPEKVRSGGLGTAALRNSGVPSKEVQRI